MSCKEEGNDNEKIDKTAGMGVESDLERLIIRWQSNTYTGITILVIDVPADVQAPT